MFAMLQYVLMLPCAAKFLLIGNFCVLQDLIFAIDRDWFFVPGIIFCDFQPVAYNWNYNMFVIQPFEIQLKQWYVYMIILVYY